MNLIPTENRVVIKVKKQDKHIKGTNLIMPEAAVERELGFGECMSGEYEGKSVYFKKYVGDEIVVDGEILYVVDFDDILAYVK